MNYDRYRLTPKVGLLPGRFVALSLFFFLSAALWYKPGEITIKWIEFICFCQRLLLRHWPCRMRTTNQINRWQRFTNEKWQQLIASLFVKISNLNVYCFFPSTATSISSEVVFDTDTWRNVALKRKWALSQNWIELIKEKYKSLYFTTKVDLHSSSVQSTPISQFIT